MLDNDIYLDILVDMLKGNKVLYAPKSGKSLKLEYPELREKPEFKELSDHEMLFVWAWACVSSPLSTQPTDKRLKACIDFAYPTEQQRKTKTSDFSGARFPSAVQAAIRAMESINLQARIEEMAFLLQLRENCKRTIAQDVSKMDPEEQKLYWDNVKKARVEMVETRHVVEKGALGLADEEDTFVPKIKKGLIGLYHKNAR